MRLPLRVYPERRRDSSPSVQNDTPLSLPRTFQVLAMTRTKGLRMISLCHCEADEVSRSNLGGDRGLPRFARNDKKGEAQNDKK